MFPPNHSKQQVLTALQLVCTLHAIADDFVKTAGWTMESTNMHMTAEWFQNLKKWDKVHFCILLMTGI